MNFNLSSVSSSTSLSASRVVHSLIPNIKIMEWTNDDALELIEQYRGHTELWNRADPKYKDKLCRFRAWSEIAERFGCSKAEVERKMNVLLTQYRREKHKMLVKLYQGIQPNPSKWYAFKRFDFMEAGGGSSSSGGSGHSIGGGGATNGHSAAAAAAAALNGLGFETSAGSLSAAAASAAPSTSHHRRMKSKEMKYFGAMGLNLPMLLANSQTLDTWNAVGQFSPPISSGGGSDRNTLRVPLPMSFSASTQNELNAVTSATNDGTRSLFGGGGSSCDGSPQKPMDTSDIGLDIGDLEETKRERATPTNTHDSGTASGGGGCGAGAEPGSSPIPNTNTHDAHSVGVAAARLRLDARDQEELDIKQELVDYFHAPHPPAPPDSHRSYSSNEENRLGGGGGGGAESSDDFAQDLRVSAAAAAAGKGGLDFSRFVLPRNLRRSSESIDEKFTPLNMRKLNAAAAAAAAATNAGQMLMNSLLSNESMSADENASLSGRGGMLKGSGAGGGGGGCSQDATSSSNAAATAAAAAAAYYAESLNKDDCDFIGSNVTLKLRSMDRTQRIIAEKLISEVLFFGQFNELERSARIQPK